MDGTTGHATDSVTLQANTEGGMMQRVNRNGRQYFVEQLTTVGWMTVGITSDDEALVTATVEHHNLCEQSNH